MLQILYALLLCIGPLLFYFSLALFSYRFLLPDDDDQADPATSSELKLQNTRRKLCTSSNCVRCNQNKKVLSSGFYRFRKAGYSRQGQQFARIEHALEFACSDESKIFFQMDFNEDQSTTTERPIWHVEDLPTDFVHKLTLLQQNYQMLAEECEQAFKFGHLWRRNEEPQYDSNWFTYSLINQGAWQEEQCRECPRLTSLLHELDSGILLTDCLFGNVFISMLPANSAIAEHHGLTNARLRVHFGIEIPTEMAEKCWMRVGNEKFHWSQGGAVVIDDSLPHSVSSRGCPQDRVVLVLDFWHSQLQRKEMDCLRHIFPAIYT